MSRGNLRAKLVRVSALGSFALATFVVGLADAGTALAVDGGLVAAVEQSAGQASAPAVPAAPKPEPAVPESAVAAGDGGVVPGITVPGKAKIVRGLAVAPANTPVEVLKIIAAANAIAYNPYRYGGGHGRNAFTADVSPDAPFDCSGTASRALSGADLLDRPLASYDFPTWEGGAAGEGKWVTIYTNRGHMYLKVAGLRYDTSSRRERSYFRRGLGGSRWSAKTRSASGYQVLHPKGAWNE